LEHSEKFFDTFNLTSSANAKASPRPQSREAVQRADRRPRSSTRPQSRFLALDDRPPGELTGLCRPQARPNELLSHDPTLGVLCWKVEHSGDANKVGKLAGTSPPEGS